MTDEEIKESALAFARANKMRIARELTDRNIYKPDDMPVSIFMAGSPGAGKTEYSKSFIELIEQGQERQVIRIDGDELRSRLPGYSGGNSFLFQGAISLIVEKMQDLALHNSQSFILDGTFSHYAKAADNVRRSLAKDGRLVIVFYVYQKPEVAWKFTVAREEKEGRNIPREAFIEQFLAVRENIARLRVEFGNRLNIRLVKKDYSSHSVEYVKGIYTDGPTIDQIFEEQYTREQLEKII